MKLVGRACRMGVPGRPVIDIREFPEDRHVLIREIGDRVRQGMLARPPDVLKRIDEARPTAQAYKPVAAVARRPKHRILRSEQSEGCGDIGYGNVRNIAPYNDDGTRRQSPRGAGHAVPKIARALGQYRKTPRPGAGSIGSDPQPCQPARIVANPAQEARQGSALEAHRLDWSDVTRQPMLSGTEARRSREDDEVTRELHC